MSNRNLILGAAALLVFLMWLMRAPTPSPPASKPKPQAVAQPRQENSPPSQAQAEAPAEVTVEPTVPVAPEVVTEKDPKSKKPVLPYKMKHGLMVVQGDAVVGVPTNPEAADSGYVIVPAIKQWKGNIAYHIQPNLPNPERVLEAIAMFDGTAIHFTPYTNEDNVLVFEPGEQDCLSYVGQMGGKQPVWISPDCRAADVAHEILHALGFVHEQNRADRDGYVEMNMDGIDERYMDNFEKLGPEFMKVSGLGPFDFQSLMIYPPWMFAKNGQSTMRPKLPDKLIEPSAHLSAGDIERLNKAYAR